MIINKIVKNEEGENINDIISGFMAVYGKGMMPAYHTSSISVKLNNE
jgi:hypothetical protein